MRHGRLRPCEATSIIVFAKHLAGGWRINTHLHNLETHTGDITLGVAGTTETGDENLVVLINEVEATVVGHEGRDLLTVLDELNTHALTHSGVRLLGLDTNLLENDPLSVRATGERLGPLLAQVTTLVALVRPVVVLALGAQLATGAKSVGLTLHMEFECQGNGHPVCAFPHSAALNCQRPGDRTPIQAD
jgi:hypothetical protein